MWTSRASVKGTTSPIVSSQTYWLRHSLLYRLAHQLREQQKGHRSNNEARQKLAPCDFPLKLFPTSGLSTDKHLSKARFLFCINFPSDVFLLKITHCLLLDSRHKSPACFKLASLWHHKRESTRGGGRSRSTLDFSPGRIRHFCGLTPHLWFQLTKLHPPTE